MKKQGFTLIELLVVIAIIAILAAILFPVFVSAKASAQKGTCVSNLKQAGQCLMLYAGDNNECFPNQTMSWSMTWWWGQGWFMKVLRYAPVSVQREFSGNVGVGWYNTKSTLFFCPTVSGRKVPNQKSGTSGISYAYNGLIGNRGAGTIMRPSKLVAFRDWKYADYNFCLAIPWTWTMPSGKVLSVPWDYDMGIPESFSEFPHSNQANVCWADGHVSSVRKGGFGEGSYDPEKQSKVPNGK